MLHKLRTYTFHLSMVVMYMTTEPPLTLHVVLEDEY